MWTHFSFLWWVLDDHHERYRDDEDLFESIQQVPADWPGPLKGHGHANEKIYYTHGELQVHENWAAEMREDVLKMPGQIIDHAPAYSREYILDSLARLLAYIDPGQLAPETAKFIAGRMART